MLRGIDLHLLRLLDIIISMRSNFLISCSRMSVFLSLLHSVQLFTGAKFQSSESRIFLSRLSHIHISLPDVTSLLKWSFVLWNMCCWTSFYLHDCKLFQITKTEKHFWYSAQKKMHKIPRYMSEYIWGRDWKHRSSEYEIVGSLPPKLLNSIRVSSPSLSS
jgi:hypothetical protein